MDKLIEKLCGDKTLSKIEKKQYFREAVTSLHEIMKTMPESYSGEVANKLNPLKHTFGDGFYMRQVTCPKGQIIVTKIHKKENPLFLLKGKCTIVTEEGAVEFIAPCYTITQPGTQRLIRMDDECVYVTVHVTEATTVEEAEEDVIAKDFNDPLVKLEINDTKTIKE